MQTYHLKLQSEIFKTFRCVRAANSLDINPEKKSIHELTIRADIESPFQVGLILGASGSGKTTLAKQIYGQNVFKTNIDPSLPILDQFPKEMSYDECTHLLCGIGLTSVPCWIRPVYTLSNGQRARAEAALSMVDPSNKIIVIDEWTSVVDRTVAKVMSHCVQKFARRNQKKVILLSCHYDVVEWLNPDWIIDCNKQEFIDRRLLCPESRQRTERLQFDIKETDSSSWKYFSKYHYLSERLAGGKNYFYGIFHNNTQIGFNAFSRYVPCDQKLWHFNRLVIHPDYVGLGLGIKFLNESCRLFYEKLKNIRIMGKFSSQPVYQALSKNIQWKLRSVDLSIGNKKIKVNKFDKTFRTNLRTYSFEFIALK